MLFFEKKNLFSKNIIKSFREKSILAKYFWFYITVFW